ncbi:MAG: 2-oxoacid:acceptor oxidoreductase family protein [Proteobacteria bacterium]|nr:2-oxoacid:acceptor oxidoreductase family protein [Pseudomonadota bacterium]
MQQSTIQIRWHGRGGQGAITAAKIVANAAFFSGYNGAVMIPTFGTERRGAPVLTSLKISKEKIYDLSPIVNPDIVVVLDYLLLEEKGTLDGLKEGGMIIVNSPKTPEEYSYGHITVATADVTSIAESVGLKRGIVNTGIIGAFSKASGLIGIDILSEKIKDEFRDIKPEENAEAARLTFAKTVVGGK